MGNHQLVGEEMQIEMRNLKVNPIHACTSYRETSICPTPTQLPTAQLFLNLKSLAISRLACTFAPSIGYNTLNLYIVRGFLFLTL